MVGVTALKNKVEEGEGEEDEEERRGSKSLLKGRRPIQCL